MISLLSRGVNIIIFQYKVLNLTNLQINTIVYIKYSDLNYMNDKDEHI